MSTPLIPLNNQEPRLWFPHIPNNIPREEKIADNLTYLGNDLSNIAIKARGNENDNNMASPITDPLMTPPARSPKSKL